MQTNIDLARMLVNQMTINEDLARQVKTLNEDNNRLRQIDGSNIKVINDSAIFLEVDFEDLIEKYQVYGIRYKDILISPLAKTNGYKARFGAITVKARRDESCYCKIDIYVEYEGWPRRRCVAYDDRKGIMTYRSEFGSYDYYVVNSIIINMVRKPDFHTEADHERRISIGHGYILRFFVNKYGYNEGAMELMNPDGSLLLDGDANLYLDAGIYMDVRGNFNEREPAGAE